MRCSEHAESPAARRGVPPAAYPAAGSTLVQAGQHRVVGPEIPVHPDPVGHLGALPDAGEGDQYKAVEAMSKYDGIMLKIFGLTIFGGTLSHGHG
jgi:hypothetical protein